MSTLSSYPLRLPSYRSSYMNRYHPYSRARRRHDHFQHPAFGYGSWAEETLWDDPPEVALQPTRSRRDDPDGDVSYLDLDAVHPADDVKEACDEEGEIPQCSETKSRAFITRIILVVGYTSRTALAFRSWIERSTKQLVK